MWHLLKTFNKPFATSYAIVAAATPICNVLMQTKTFYRTLFQINPLRNSFTFSVSPCKHFLIVSDPRSLWENTILTTLTAFGMSIVGIYDEVYICIRIYHHEDKL